MGFRNVLAPSTAGIPRTTMSGRTYSGATVAVDRGNLDTSELLSAGWVRLADHTGPTSARPTIDELGAGIVPGFRYLDTTLGRVVVAAGGQWIDASTGVAS